MSAHLPDLPESPAPTSAIDVLEGAMRRRGIRIEIRLTAAGPVRATAHATGLLAHEPGQGQGPTIREALRALAHDLTDKGA